MSDGWLRLLVLSLFRWMGVLRLWRWWHRNDLTIVMLHGVMDGEDECAWVPLRPQLSRQRLDRCLRILARRYRFVSLDAAVAMLTRRIPVRPYSLVLTFDDGYRNHLKYALPILRQWKAPGAFFVATGHVESRKPFWFDRLDYVLQQLPVDGREFGIGPGRIRLKGSDRASLRTSYKELRDAAKAVRRHDYDMLRELEGIAETLETESGRSLAHIFEEDDWTSLLSWEDIKREASPDVIFGSHTVDHVRLALVGPTDAEDQLRRSKEAIEAHTGRPCRYLCYPNGSVTAVVATAAARCGYEAAVTADAGLNRVGDDPMLLKRFNLPEAGGVAETLAEISGLADALRGGLVRFCHRRRSPDRHQ